LSAIVRLDGLASIAPDYDVIFLDIWGVVHDGRRLSSSTMNAANAFRATGGGVILLSNSPQPSHVIPAQLRRLGMENVFYDHIITSGDATRALIEKLHDQRFFTIGPKSDEALYQGLTIARSAAIEEADMLVCTGLFDEEREVPEDYRPLFETALARKAGMICANPDIYVPFGNGLVWCAGALARLYAAMGGNVIQPGKPHAPIYALARSLVKSDARILAVGDGPQTDLAGAMREGVDAVYVVSGLSRGLCNGADGDDIAQFLQAQGVTARWFTHELHW
jgi:HAD superfamily hydrolase (TIGR01459 family)